MHIWEQQFYTLLILVNNVVSWKRRQTIILFHIAVQILNLIVINNYLYLFFAGHTLEAQKSLFDNIRPLFANKPLILVANKTDIWKDNLSEEKKAVLNEFKIDLEEDRILEMSTKDDEESVAKVKIEACEILLQHRVEQKFKTKKVITIYIYQGESELFTNGLSIF